MKVDVVRYHKQTDRFFLNVWFDDKRGRDGTGTLLEDVPLTIMDDGSLIFQVNFGPRRYVPQKSGMFRKKMEPTVLSGNANSVENCVVIERK